MGIFNADVIINIPPAFFSLQKSGLVRVYLTSVFLLLSVPRCFGDQKPQFDFVNRKFKGLKRHKKKNIKNNISWDSCSFLPQEDADSRIPHLFIFGIPICE